MASSMVTAVLAHTRAVPSTLPPGQIDLTNVDKGLRHCLSVTDHSTVIPMH